MTLFDDVVQMLDLPDLDGRFPFSVDGLKGGQIHCVERPTDLQSVAAGAF
jgi:hypothetical protein